MGSNYFSLALIPSSKAQIHIYGPACLQMIHSFSEDQDIFFFIFPSPSNQKYGSSALVQDWVMEQWYMLCFAIFSCHGIWRYMRFDYFEVLVSQHYSWRMNTFTFNTKKICFLHLEVMLVQACEMYQSTCLKTPLPQSITRKLIVNVQGLN